MNAKNMHKTKIVALMLAALVPMAAVAKGNIAEGQKKAETCKACHGEGGLKPIQPDYPVIGGQHRDYLVASLQQYKSGKRKNASMNGFAAALKPQDIEDLAAYFASQPSPLKMKY
jgi:cytochrome c553